jgi:membrane-bound serine protease (ClpP class)
VVFIRRGIQEAKSAGAGTIVFRINTFGGRVDSALQIASLIGAERELETVAFIPAAAESLGVSWSAGALISFACSSIYMSPGTSIGAAAPVFQTSEGMEMAPEKSVSAVRTQLAALAEKNGYPVGVALAMVDDDVVLREVEVDGELRLLTDDEYAALKRSAERDGVSLEEGRVISDKDKLLTLTAGQMETYGISSGSAATIEELAELLGFGAAGILEQEYTALDRLVVFISSSAVVSLLVLVGLVALYLEITSPGFGVPGTVAILAFTVVFLGSALLGYFDSLELILLLAGIALLTVEIFIIPGFGAAGISGIAFMAAALILSQQDFIVPELPWQRDIMLRNAGAVGIAFLGSFVFFGILLLVVPRTRFFNRLVLGPADPERNPAAQPAVAQPGRRDFLGESGAALTELHPSGTARIAGSRMSVQTRGEFLPAGSRLTVIETRGNRVVVREAD